MDSTETGLWLDARNVSGSRSRNNLMICGFHAHHRTCGPSWSIGRCPLIAPFSEKHDTLRGFCVGDTRKYFASDDNHLASRIQIGDQLMIVEAVGDIAFDEVEI